jgi:hypothetical protein
MKKLVYIFVFPLILATSSVVNAQNYADAYLGLPGDNLNLFAVMKLFQESETLEGFERSLNDENTRINNLDLNGDNRIDYIRVIDNSERNLHMIVLQVGISARENQDVAVFYVERESNNQVRIQLIGDEALYGKNYIVEPNYSDYAGETPNPGYTGNTMVFEGQPVVVNRVTTYEVAAWPLIRFIFMPGYVVWHSPWYFGYYPHWWSPWRPYYWHYYYGYHSHWNPHYYGHYRYCDHYYSPQYHNHYYSSRRSYSPYVSNHISTGYYKNTYSRPETRRAGSELYARTVSNNGSRTEARTLGNSQMKRTSVASGTRTLTQRDPGTASSDTRRLSSAGRVSTSATHKSTEATTGRTYTKPVTKQSSVRTESRSSSTGRVSTSTSHKPSETAAGRTSAKPVTKQSSVRTETRSSSAGRVSNSTVSKSTGNTAAKPRSRGSSDSEKTREVAQRSSSGRR